jgi:DNA-binding MarR family transcriptional regulator
MARKMEWYERYREVDAGEYTPEDSPDISIWYWDEKGFTFEITRGEDGRIVYPKTKLGDMARPRNVEAFKRMLKEALGLSGREGGKKASSIARDILVEYRELNVRRDRGLEDEDDSLIEHDALELLEEGDLLYEVDRILEKGIRIPGKDHVRFVCGEKGKRLYVWLAMFSAKTPYPQFTMIVGEPGTGKTNLIETALLLLPEGLVRRRGYITGAGIRYGEGEGDSLLYLQEYRDRAEQDIRLLSPYDGGFYAEIAVRDKETGEMTTIVYDVKCRGFITSTAGGLPSGQMLRRLLLISTDSSEEITREVNRRKALFSMGREEYTAEEKVEAVKRAVELLEPRRVVIPYAPLLVDIAPWDRSTLDRLLDLIRIIANVYQYQRPQLEDGRIVALPWDLYVAMEVSADVLVETISCLPDTHRRILNAIANSSSKLPTAKKLTEMTGIPQKTIYNRCRDMISLGYITATDERPKRYEITEKGLKFIPSSLRGQISWGKVGKETLDFLRSCIPEFPKGIDRYKKYICISSWECGNKEKKGIGESTEGKEDDKIPLKKEGIEKPLKASEEAYNKVLGEEARERHRSLIIFIKRTCKGEHRGYVTIGELQLWAVDNGVPFEVLDRDLAFLKSEGRLYNPRGPGTWGVV